MEPSDKKTPSPELQKLIDASHPDVRQYLAGLNAENAKLHKTNIKLEVELTSLTNRNKGLMEECQDLKRHASPLSHLSVREKARRLMEAMEAENKKP